MGTTWMLRNFCSKNNCAMAIPFFPGTKLNIHDGSLRDTGHISSNYIMQVKRIMFVHLIWRFNKSVFEIPFERIKQMKDFWLLPCSLSE